MDTNTEKLSLDIDILDERNATAYAECYNKYKSLLSRANISKEEFAREYRQFCDTEWKEKGFYFVILDELEIAVLKGDVNTIKRLDSLIAYINDIEDKSKLKDFYNSTNNPINNSNLVILACKYNKLEILKYIFSNSRILNNLSINIGRSAITFNDKDEACHNAFYYSVRSNNLELLSTLINEWPGDYLATRSLQLDEALSSAYEELKLKNVPLSDEIQMYIENKLIDLRFFSDDFDHNQTMNNTFDNIKERIDLMVEYVNLLEADYSIVKRVDERFLFLTKCIAENIHVLKQQLKSTYNRIPWEEMEFCLTSFISSHMKRQEINLFYRAILNKNKMLRYLKNFSEVLENETVFALFTDLAKEKREVIVAKIINSYPQFEGLFVDHRQIRDVYTLQRMNDYIKLALAVDSEQREGQLVILRTLQVVGDCLKNTLESPKLSHTANKLLILSLPESTREVIVDLRNSPSHTYSLAKRLEIEENSDVKFFAGVQNDIKEIGATIDAMLHEKKILLMKTMLEKIIDSENLDEIEEAAEAFSNSGLNLTTKDFETLERDELEVLVKELDNAITEKTEFEQMLLHEILDIISMSKSSKSREDNKTENYWMPFYMLKCVSLLLSSNNKIDNNVVRSIKCYAKEALKNITLTIKSRSLKDIAELLQMIFSSIELRMRNDYFDFKIQRIMCKISYLTEFGAGNIKWIEGLGAKLNEKASSVPSCKPKGRFKDLLPVKLSELRDILTANGLMNNLTADICSYKNNRILQSMIEMLVLDILDISDDYLEHNLFFCDDNSPLLTGKCLRNYLARDNTLVNILLSDPSVMVLLNAKKLVSEDIMNNEKKFGKTMKDGCLKFRDKYHRNLISIANQKGMFAALEEGRFEDMKGYLQAGADIHARNANSWTALHCAAKGSNLEIVDFVLDHDLDIHVIDADGQTPLHIAAASGSTDIVQFFVEEMHFDVNVKDNNKRTPLHVAAEHNHQDIVEILLANRAKIDIQDIGGNTPLNYAIRNNCVDIVKLLMEKDANININEKTVMEFTPLHTAAESGYSELVKFILENKADVNARSDRYVTPLHLASLNGHVKVVNALISNGADVNAKVIEGCAALHYAVENGHEAVAEVLLTHGADPNVVDKANNTTPLHYAATYGYKDIVKSLLRNGANANVTTFMGTTPLHFAAQGGHLEVINILINHGALVNAEDEIGATALYHAASKGYKEIVEVLLKNKANINVKTIGSTPLHAAAEAKQGEVVNLLIQNKAKVNVKDIRGMTPLHIAAASPGNENIVELLTKNKAAVNAKNKYGMTPLHIAASAGCVYNALLLIRYNANVNAVTKDNQMPLHLAVRKGHKEIVTLLTEHNADVNARGERFTPLNLAVLSGHKEIVEVLFASGARIDDEREDLIMLLTAVKFNQKEIVELLIANGVDVRSQSEGCEALALAVTAGYTEIVEILLRNGVSVNGRFPDKSTILHVAAGTRHINIVNILISRKADVNAVNIRNAVPLHAAAQKGHDKVVESLITNGARVDVKSVEGNSPLHLAIEKGHSNIVKILLANGARIDDKDGKNKTPLEVAVANGHLDIVKTLLLYKKVDLNTNYNGWTLLHIASQIPNLEMVKYLVDEGADVHGEDSCHSKPIHLAAKEGHKDIVEYFLSKDLSVNEFDADNKTPLHYAVQGRRLEVVKYLIGQDADVNATSNVGTTPLHVAVTAKYRDIVEVLLKNGAMYNSADKFNKLPFESTNDERIVELLTVIGKLFEAVKRNDVATTKRHLKAGAFVNARDANDVTPLHYAAWRGYSKVVEVLLQNAANPDAISKGYTPLHYAAKFSHLKVVTTLLSKSATYNVVSTNGKTPLDLATNKCIKNLLTLISKSFEKVKNDDVGIVDELNQINDIETIKAVMNTRNEENKTLVVAAIHSNFSKVEDLKEVSQGNISSLIEIGKNLLKKADYEGALNIFRSAYEKRKAILGSENPASLDVQTHVALTLYKQGSFQEALTMYEEIYQKQNETLGSYHKDTLSSKCMIALALHRLARDAEALNIYRDVYQKQEEILGPKHEDTMNTQFHMAMALDKLGKYDEALTIYTIMFEKRKKEYGINDPITVSAQNNIAMVLNNQGKSEEALKIFEKVLEKKKTIYGIAHTDTLRTLHNIAGIHFQQNRYQEAMKSYQNLISIQETALGPDHPETLNTHHSMISLLVKQGKRLGALKACMKVLHRMEAVFSPSHPILWNTLKIMEAINFTFKLEGTNVSTVIRHMQEEINTAAISGDVPTIERMFNEGLDLNDKDVDGRTPLHYAASKGRIHVVDFLLNNGADVHVASDKGNTPLHSATTNGHIKVVELLLQNVNRDKLSNCINAKTTAAGTAPLHIAAKNDSLDIVCCLLGYGAIYNVKNKEGKTPLDLSKNQRIVDLLKMIDESFRDAKNDNIEIINKLKFLKASKPDEFVAVTNARNNRGNTLLQVAIFNKHKNIASELLKMLK